MTRLGKREKAERIAKLLDRLYPEPPVPLRHEDPFTLLVSVVLSAQCTDARVNQVTPALFAEAPTPAALARLPVARIQRLIQSCGLAPQKARSLSGLAKQLKDVSLSGDDARTGVLLGPPYPALVVDDT